MERARRIYIISDWHLGGSEDSLNSTGQTRYGTQICRSSRSIAEFIKWVVAQPKGEEDIELIINGDLIDFLAPAPSWKPSEWITSEDRAIGRLEEIVATCQRAGRALPEAK